MAKISISRRNTLKILKKILQLTLPFALGLGILWWMYRGTNWHDFFHSVFSEMKWGWMLFSFVFGILAQQIRAWRWRMALAPLGEHPRRCTCEDAIFISYAASLVIPRVGEVTRCGTLKKYDGVSFTKSLGTVFTERVIDSLVMLILTGVAFLFQVPVFLKFIRTTGMDFGDFFGQFTGTGYLVTILCLVMAIGAAVYFVKHFYSRGRDLLKDLWAGILSLKDVSNLPLYLLMSFGISLCYYLHFYIAFFCFNFTSSITPIEAFLIYCIGMFAVLVPTPNGAGSWHFAVKTMLVLYGVAEKEAILFALVVHTLQTGLVVLLGAFGFVRVSLKGKNKTIKY